MVAWQAISPATAADALVSFDAPAMAVAVPVNPETVTAPLTGGKLVRVRIPVSTFLSPAFEGVVNEYVVEIHCPQQSMRVVDFGSGKGYLTFAVHDYLTNTRAIEASVTGVELREERIHGCLRATTSTPRREAFSRIS